MERFELTEGNLTKMGVKEAIGERRAYHSLQDIEITRDLVMDLAECAQLAPSCFNSQPWRFIFAYDQDILKRLRGTLSKGNEWAHFASMIVAVFSKEDLDCVIKERKYYLFDCGVATAFMILRATELGIVAHPIAGYSEEMVKEILGIPSEMRVIALVIVGKHSRTMRRNLSEKQIRIEKRRPDRLPLEEFVYMNAFKKD